MWAWDASRNVRLVGDGCCGKSYLQILFTTGEYADFYLGTARERHYAGDVEVDGKKVHLSLIDCSGQEDYDQLRAASYLHSGTDAFMICFSVEDPELLARVEEKWVPEVKHFCPGVPFLLVANKVDTRTDPVIIKQLARRKQSPVSPEEGKAVANRIGARGYYECSAKTNEGVTEVFENLARVALTYEGVRSGLVERSGLGDKLKSVFTPNKEPGTPFDGQFNMNSLRQLEAVDINILTELAGNLEKFVKCAGITVSTSQRKELEQCATNIDRLEVIIDMWVSGESRYWSPTWSALETVLFRVGLTRLAEQISGYFGRADYLYTYRKVLATHEYIEMWFVKVILLGAPRLGKTTARRRLTGKIKDICSSGEEVQPSTGVVESAPTVVIRSLAGNSALITQNEWISSKDLTDEARLFIQFLHSQMRSTPKKQNVKKMMNEFSRSKVRPSRFARKDADFEKAKPTRKSGHKVNSSEARHQPAMAEVAELLRNAISPKYWEDINHLFEDTAYLKMEDTGGQPEFMDMLPALTIGPALYLLFCKLTDDLKSHYTVSYLSPSGESTITEKSAYTVEELFLSALASISCFKSYTISDAPSKKAAPSSLAYVVGTHKDKVTEVQLDEFDKKLQESIRPTDFFKEGLVKFSSENRMVLPIDNMNGGDSEIEKVQKFLEKGLKQHFKKIRIPAAWFVLSLCLRKREERIASLQSVIMLAKELGIPRKEVTSALQFLHHHAGLLMYFPELEELRDTVICDTQIVYDSTTNLIVNSFKFGRVDMAASEQFRETGQFSLQDIKKATEDISGDYIPLQKLVKLLEHLSIIAPITQVNPTPSQPTSLQSPNVTYFMPCVLQNLTHEDLDKWWARACDPLSPAPLFIRYKGGYSPIGVFPAMVASFVGQGSVRMIYDGIKKNRVQFRFGSDYDTVTLISHPKYYAVHISRTSYAEMPTHEACIRVRGLVESTLKNVSSHMNYSFNMEYQLAFECPTHPGRDHLCIVESRDGPRSMLCLYNAKDLQPKEMFSQHLIWFNQKAVSAYNPRLNPQPSPQPIGHHLAAQTFPAYVSSLPPSARPHLELELDWGHGGVESDLYEIADHMLKWEEKLSAPLGLTEVDINDITRGISSLVLQRREALRKWKSKQGLRATYGNLLELFVKAGHTQCAEAVCEVIRKKYSAQSSSKMSSWNNSS